MRKAKYTLRERKCVTTHAGEKRDFSTPPEGVDLGHSHRQISFSANALVWTVVEFVDSNIIIEARMCSTEMVHLKKEQLRSVLLNASYGLRDARVYSPFNVNERCVLFHS